MRCIRLQGIDGRNTGGERCALRSGRPSSTLRVMTLEDRQRDEGSIEHPTRSRPLTVVEQQHGDYCGQSGSNKSNLVGAIMSPDDTLAALVTPIRQRENNQVM